MRRCAAQRSDTPLSSWLFHGSKVTGTLRQMVFISLSAARLQGNPGRRSPLSCGRDVNLPPVEVKGHRAE